ncbi:MAG: hypothetical protein JEY79_17315, partial [Pseudodesulfovibrio sp.]|nr:hypothetical protein [Pseudodesulfovibrio sp.]
GTGKSRLETAEGLGIRFDVAPNLPIMDGINAARMILPRCWFDRGKCNTGIEALRQYRQNYNDKTGIYSASPLHDWTSHAADAFRYLAVGMDLCGHSGSMTAAKAKDLYERYAPPPGA